MKLRIELDLSLSPTQKRSLRRGAAATILAGLLGAGVVAMADPGALGIGVTPQTAPIDAGWIVSGVPINAALLQGNLNDLQTQITALGNTDCPVGYINSGSPAATFLPNSIVCVNSTTSDQVVKVGTGPAAFWIDRYEATVWREPAPVDGGLVPSGYSTADSGVPNNGQTISPLYALSLPGYAPSAYVTWYQATEFCKASGKRLPGRQEWLGAARGTVDPTVATNGAETPQCNTSTGVRASGLATGSSATQSCISAWGAEDMIGNVWEMVDEWYAAPAVPPASPVQSYPWTADYNGDETENIASAVSATGVGIADGGLGAPAGVIRGGSFSDGTSGGIFAMWVGNSPTAQQSNIGFRCVVPSGH